MQNYDIFSKPPNKRPKKDTYRDLQNWIRAVALTDKDVRPKI